MNTEQTSKNIFTFPKSSWKQKNFIPKTSIAKNSFKKVSLLKCDLWSHPYGIVENKRIWVIRVLKKKEALLIALKIPFYIRQTHT